MCGAAERGYTVYGRHLDFRDGCGRHDSIEFIHGVNAIRQVFKRMPGAHSLNAVTLEWPSSAQINDLIDARAGVDIDVVPSCHRGIAATKVYFHGATVGKAAIRSRTAR